MKLKNLLMRSWGDKLTCQVGVSWVLVTLVISFIIKRWVGKGYNGSLLLKEQNLKPAETESKEGP